VYLPSQSLVYAKAFPQLVGYPRSKLENACDLRGKDGRRDVQKYKLLVKLVRTGGNTNLIELAVKLRILGLGKTTLAESLLTKAGKTI